jgi:peptidoglycan/LPS O-acetylase OafA/YrhL
MKSIQFIDEYQWIHLPAEADFWRRRVALIVPIHTVVILKASDQDA